MRTKSPAIRSICSSGAAKKRRAPRAAHSKFEYQALFANSLVFYLTVNRLRYRRQPRAGAEEAERRTKIDKTGRQSTRGRRRRNILLEIRTQVDVSPALQKENIFEVLRIFQIPPHGRFRSRGIILSDRISLLMIFRQSACLWILFALSYSRVLHFSPSLSFFISFISFLCSTNF